MVTPDNNIFHYEQNSQEIKVIQLTEDGSKEIVQEEKVKSNVGKVLVGSRNKIYFVGY